MLSVLHSLLLSPVWLVGSPPPVSAHHCDLLFNGGAIIDLGDNIDQVLGVAVAIGRIAAAQLDIPGDDARAVIVPAVWTPQRDMDCIVAKRSPQVLYEALKAVEWKPTGDQDAC
jgi:hypothetical protein